MDWKIAGHDLVPSQTITSGENSSHQTPPKCAGEHESLIVPLHPLRIKPAGNAYTATENIKMAAGIFVTLPDELLIQVLELLDAASLQRLGCACKALYAFSRLEELWKTLCIMYAFPHRLLFLLLFYFRRVRESRCHNLPPCRTSWSGYSLPLRLISFYSARCRLQGVDGLSPEDVHIIRPP